MNSAKRWRRSKTWLREIWIVRQSHRVKWHRCLFCHSFNFWLQLTHLRLTSVTVAGNLVGSWWWWRWRSWWSWRPWSWWWWWWGRGRAIKWGLDDSDDDDGDDDEAEEKGTTVMRMMSTLGQRELWFYLHPGQAAVRPESNPDYVNFVSLTIMMIVMIMLIDADNDGCYWMSIVMMIIGEAGG